MICFQAVTVKCRGWVRGGVSRVSLKAQAGLDWKIKSALALFEQIRGPAIKVVDGGVRGLRSTIRVVAWGGGDGVTLSVRYSRSFVSAITLAFRAFAFLSVHLSAQCGRFGPMS